MGMALKARWAISLADRKTTRLKSAKAEILFKNSDDGFFNGMVISRNIENRLLKLRSVAQGGSAGNTGVGAIVSGEQRNFAAARIDAPTGNARAKFIKERPQHAGDSAADYDYVGFQQIDGVSQINCQEFNSFEQRSCGDGITACVCLIHELSSDCGDFSASQIEHRRLGQAGGLQFCLSAFCDGRS